MCSCGDSTDIGKTNDYNETENETVDSSVSEPKVLYLIEEEFYGAFYNSVLSTCLAYSAEAVIDNWTIKMGYVEYKDSIHWVGPIYY